MDPPKLRVSARLRDMLSYDKLAGPVPRILILESQYWLDEACINAAGQMGWEIATVPMVMKGVLPRETVAQFLETLAHFKPDFILTINLCGMDVNGVFARLLEDLRIPYVTWFVDDPRTIIMDRTIFASTYTVALTWDSGYVDYLHGAGFPVVVHLPLAVDPCVFDAEPAENWDIPPTFVGNYMTESVEEEWVWLNERPELAAAIRAALDAGRVTRARFARGLEALLDHELLASLDPDEKRHAELLFFIEGTRRLRRKLIETLKPDGLEVRGGDEWKSIFPDAGGPVNYRQELPELYRRCELNLNTTSVQMPSTVNQRVFDCPAAGGFLLTDGQSALGDLFDLESEVACYSSLEECRELFRWYLAHPEARREIIVRARRRVLGEHTYINRLQRIVALLKETFSAT